MTATDSGCDHNYPTDSASATFPPSITSSTSATSTSIPYVLTNASSPLSNLSTTMATVSTSAAASSYLNTTISSATNVDVPTSILVATGTPMLPTITSYEIVTPSTS